MLIPARTGSLKKCIPLLSKRLEAWKTLSDMDEETNQDDMRIMSSKFRRESIIPEQFVMCHYRGRLMDVVAFILYLSLQNLQATGINYIHFSDD